MTCIALIVAAGRGSRFGGDIPKQYQTLDGLPVLRHAALAFRSHPQVTQVGVVIHPDDRALYDNAVGDLDLLPPISGGAERQESARYGLEALAASPPATVLIHDAARPRTPQSLIDRVIDGLATHAAVVPVLPIIDTVKQSTRADSLLVSATLDRRCLWRAQTPQGFRYPEILAAHRRFAGMTLTDDAAVAEQAGLEVAMVAGDDANLKLTEIADIDRIKGHASHALEHRTGQGFDVHRFAPGDRVYLCGVEIPHVASLKGHSDADVALHALTDALLGAIGAGDIGLHFPPSDPQWRGAPSHLFLTRAAEIVAERGARVVNVDVTIICERPKVGPHRDAMQARVAELLAVEVDRVNVKATTTERLGFTGRGEGIAAQAIATLALPITSGRG